VNIYWYENTDIKNTGYHPSSRGWDIWTL